MRPGEKRGRVEPLGLPMSVTSRRKNLPADKRRDVIVEAVIALAASVNPSEITTAAIAQHMHLTQGALFRHFPNKEAIWGAVMDWVAKNLMAGIDRATEGIESPIEAIEAMFLAHVAFVAEHPGAPRMLFGELQGARATPAKRLAQAMMAQYAARLNDLIVTGKSRGELHPALDEEAASALFVGAIQGLVMQSLIADDMQRMRTAAPGVFAIYQRGVAAAETRRED